MKLCGLTGGIGMGKSTAAGFFLEHGLKLVDTDDLAHELVQPGRPALNEILHEFGPEVICPNGSLNRPEMARVVFSNPTARKRLESILHPRIRERWLHQVEQWRRDGCRTAMVVIPLLYETAAESQFDNIICVACSPAGEVERLQSRGWSESQIRGRIAAQLPVEQKMARAHFVIWTEGSMTSHRRQVDEIVRRIG